MAHHHWTNSEMPIQDTFTSGSGADRHDYHETQLEDILPVDQVVNDTGENLENVDVLETEPPQAIFQRSVLDAFSKALQWQTRKATFTCGGTLPILLTPEGRMKSGELTPILNERFNGQRMMARGVAVRWGSNGAGSALTLPALDAGEGEALQRLIGDCKPATFGRGGEDVYDESYRRAGALDTKDFMTDFCPYESGLVSIIEQYLLPPVAGELEPQVERSKIGEKYGLTFDQEVKIHAAIERRARGRGDFVNSSNVQPCLEELQVAPATTEEMFSLLGQLDKLGSGLTEKADLLDVLAARLSTKAREQGSSTPSREVGPNDPKRKMLSCGLRAELYKLNVYSGPSGVFKAHVDTPRSDMHIGSLVVCLPVPFEGGALAVRHSGREVVYKWGTDKPAIRWAAFYSDCEHEVLEVTSGHRVTLTYNLYLAPGTGLLNGAPKCLDPPSLPLFGHLHKMLAAERFFPKGGYLGIHLAHSYPHTHPRLHQFVPSMLKGSDMALYEVVVAMGLAVVLDPTDKNNLSSEDVIQCLEEMYKKQRKSGGSVTFLSKLKEQKIKDGDLRGEPEYGEDDDHFDVDNLDNWFIFDEDERPSDYDSDEARERCPPKVLALKKRCDARTMITWLGEKGHTEMSETLLAYGNQAELRVRYSSAALIVKIPRWAPRQAQFGIPATKPIY